MNTEDDSLTDTNTNIMNYNDISENIQNNPGSRYSIEFREIRKIGQGGFGSVYHAVNIFDKQSYAIKKIPTSFRGCVTNSETFTKEVEIMAKINHHNIVRYHSCWLDASTDKPDILMNTEVVPEWSFGQYPSTECANDSHGENKIVLSNRPNTKIRLSLCIQMELCDFSLRSYLDNRKEIDIEYCYNICVQLIEGLEYLHTQHITHRDLNPNNILIKNGQIKISDFGLSIDNANYLPSRSAGVKLYLAPEITQGGEITNKVDIYSIGIIFYEILQPFVTQMERFISIKNFIKNKDNDAYLSSLMHDDPNKRPNIQEIKTFIMSKRCIPFVLDT